MPRLARCRRFTIRRARVPRPSACERRPPAPPTTVLGQQFLASDGSRPSTRPRRSGRQHAHRHHLRRAGRLLRHRRPSPRSRTWSTTLVVTTPTRTTPRPGFQCADDPRCRPSVEAGVWPSRPSSTARSRSSSNGGSACHPLTPRDAASAQHRAASSTSTGLDRVEPSYHPRPARCSRSRSLCERFAYQLHGGR